MVIFFLFPQWLVKPGLGPGAWRFHRDVGGMNLLGHGFQNHQHTNWSGVCWTFSGDLTMVLGSTPADRGGLCPEVRMATPSRQVGD